MRRVVRTPVGTTPTTFAFGASAVAGSALMARQAAANRSIFVTSTSVRILGFCRQGLQYVLIKSCRVQGLAVAQPLLETR